MRQILTDEEIWKIAKSTHDGISPCEDTMVFARGIESAVLAKLAEGQEAVAWYHPTDGSGLSFENHLEGNQPLYLHPSAKLAAEQAAHAATQARIEQMREALEEEERALFNLRVDLGWTNHSEFKPSKILSLPADALVAVIGEPDAILRIGSHENGGEFRAAELELPAYSLPAGTYLYRAPKTFIRESNLEEMHKELAELRKDAERYRWLHSEHNRIDPVGRCVWKRNSVRSYGDWVDLIDGTDFEKHIDAAITRAKEKK